MNLKDKIKQPNNNSNNGIIIFFYIKKNEYRVGVLQ